MPNIEDALRFARDKEQRGSSDIEAIKDAIGSLLGEDFIDQTARTTNENEAGIVAEEALNDYFENWFGFKDRIVEAVIERKMAISPSRNGAGREDIVRIFQGGVDMGGDREEGSNYRLVRP